MNKDSESITNIKAPTNTCPMRYLRRHIFALPFQYGRFVSKANDAMLLCFSDDHSGSRFLKFRRQYRSDTGAIYVKISQPGENSNANATGVVTQQQQWLHLQDSLVCCRWPHLLDSWVCRQQFASFFLAIPFDGRRSETGDVLRPASVWDRHHVFASIDILCDVYTWVLQPHVHGIINLILDSDRLNRFYAVIADGLNTSERSRVCTD